MMLLLWRLVEESRDEDMLDGCFNTANERDKKKDVGLFFCL